MLLTSQIHTTLCGSILEDSAPYCFALLPRIFYHRCQERLAPWLIVGRYASNAFCGLTRLHFAGLPGERAFVIMGNKGRLVPWLIVGIAIRGIPRVHSACFRGAHCRDAWEKAPFYHRQQEKLVPWLIVGIALRGIPRVHSARIRDAHCRDAWEKAPFYHRQQEKLVPWLIVGVAA